MTAQEMLIEVNLSLQMIGASKTRKFYDQEIEWYLNKMVNRFVQNSVRRKETSGGTNSMDVTTFEIDELYRDAIKNLIEETYLPANYNISGQQALAYLPPNYSYLTDLGGSVEKCSPFISTNLVQKVYQVIGVPLPVNSIASNAPYFANLVITINGTSAYSRSAGYSYNSAFQVIEEICNATSITQDSAGPYRKMGYLLLMVSKPTSGNASFVITYDSVTLTSSVLSTITANETGAIQSLANTPVRSLRDTINYNSNLTPYYKSSANSLTTSISGNVIQINTSTNFIVNGIWCGYIRKPSRISVSLNNTSDIDPDYHNQICDMTVQHIRERIGDPKYQTGLIDSKQ